MRHTLNGEWTFVDGETRSSITVPGCWEDAGVAKDRPGPFLYRRHLAAPADMRGRRLWLRFEGVSYHAVVRLGGRELGTHTGSWDAFEFDVTDLLEPGGDAQLLEVEVEKPASLTSGPASGPVPGRFPLKETLSGFLPYVWGHMFGGLWRDVWLEARSATASVIDAHIWALADGTFTADVALSSAASVRLEIVSPSGDVLAIAEAEGEELTLSGHVTDARPWSPHAPTLYCARVFVDGTEERQWSFGFRTVTAVGTDLMLNGRPTYPRLALSWGWYEDTLAANPGRETVRRDLLRLKDLGYNGVKLCLWVPPDYYLDVADELGMLVWLELPMWLPQPTEFFTRQVSVEYERIVRQVRRHPSLVVYSLGCELNRDVGAEILAPLFDQVKTLVGDALLRDNSGSGEAYGGLLNEHAEYYDYHFYSDIQFMAELIDYFAPRWRPVQPWLFGEFCDYDTFRDLARLRRERRERETLAPETATHPRAGPWWTSRDHAINPQGARWQYDVPFQDERLAQNGMAERAPELERASYRQALLHRKFTLELVRTYREIAGYVVTGERDTPISTAGMWDDSGEYKFPPERFRAFNDDLVLTLGWDKRRAWVNGGDRAAYWDTFSYPAGARVRAHVIAANHSDLHGPAELRWELRDDGAVLTHGALPVDLAVGEVRELGVLEFEMPAPGHPCRLDLHAGVVLDGVERYGNVWPVWTFPSAPFADVGRFVLYDPGGRLTELRTVVERDGSEVIDGSASLPATLGSVDHANRPVVVATAWSDHLDAAIASGLRAIVLLTGAEPSPFPTQRVPFWREAVKLIEPHPAWGDFPHDGFTDLQFYGMACDAALDCARQEDARALLRRVDPRTMAVLDYAVDVPWGAGRMLLSTLRLEGGLGHQPVGIGRNIAAAYLLSRWLRYPRGA